ncbi:uncharacterized protein A4U43_UnF5280 [Asparagus officinalis]|uniref:Protein kinase domain-containing protein n=1 Tax=Asparagus officinalis TaxID=4686 RepID=A0A1R3L6R0_ASPOF|nr:uncharacterized protein A4U43_UnF5280 [Asparagus officinalis]
MSYGPARAATWRRLTAASMPVQNAAQDILSLCPRYKQAIIWYDYCQLRYSDLSFFSVVDENNFWILVNTMNATDVHSFVKMETELLDKVTYRAYSSSMLFATGVLAYDGSKDNKLYALAQCTRDLSADGCNQCLQLVRERYQGYEVKVGGRVLGGSCNFRYETDVFFKGEPTVSLDLSSGPASAPFAEPPPSVNIEGSKSSTGKVLLILLPVTLGLVIILIFGIFFRKRRKRKTRPANNIHGTAATLEDISSAEWLSFDLTMLKAATGNFADSLKLGQGGFGTVYKGTLPNGEDIAVKRLSAGSRQGMQELKNELILVAKLQHKNLVRLLGVCLEEDEKLLVYEYVLNRSLDNFLFDPVRCKQLNWERRFNIIRGIARGLLYLHEESHLKVIHRDLKASNVLLDADMNPKISDFGLARLFGQDETQGITSRVVGTFGYMAPEYAQRGHFSMKLDVYSFGILVLEIMTGKRSNSFQYDSEISPDIVSYTWEHWRNGRALGIIDPSMGKISSSNEVLRCIQIGLLCAQEEPADRPPMSSVFLMLHGPSMALQEPLQRRPLTAGMFDSTAPLNLSRTNSSAEFARSLYGTVEDKVLIN